MLGSKLQVAGWTIYCALIWSLKLSMLCFYIRLTVRAISLSLVVSGLQLTTRQNGLQSRYRIGIYIGFGLVISSFIAAILAIFLSCRPFHKYWQINPDPGSK